MAPLNQFAAESGRPDARGQPELCRARLEGPDVGGLEDRLLPREMFWVIPGPRRGRVTVPARRGADQVGYFRARPPGESTPAP